MHRALITAAALIGLAGCRENLEPSANMTEPNANAPKTAQANVLGASVNGETAKKIMQNRHEGMEDIGDAMKAAARWAKSEQRDFIEVREAAATMNRLAPQASGWFPPGTGPDSGKTRAKAEIWQKPEDFAARMRAFEEAAAAFHSAAQGTDPAAISAAMDMVGKTCKACHDLYRAPEDGHK